MLSDGILDFRVDDNMVVTEVSLGSAINAASVRPGMILLRIDRAPVGDINSFKQLQIIVKMVGACLCRFSSTAAMSFTNMQNQVFNICETLHDKRQWIRIHRVIAKYCLGQALVRKYPRRLKREDPGVSTFGPATAAPLRRPWWLRLLGRVGGKAGA
eukprot:COSAG02_NODE_304_length_25204_cov_11.025095_20_plen_157_part_00